MAVIYESMKVEQEKLQSHRRRNKCCLRYNFLTNWMLKMRITNSKPTKQAERCQTLIAEKNMNNWIETSGSPFVIVEQQYAHQWKGQEKLQCYM